MPASPLLGLSVLAFSELYSVDLTKGTGRDCREGFKQRCKKCSWEWASPRAVSEVWECDCSAGTAQSWSWEVGNVRAVEASGTSRSEG